MGLFSRAHDIMQAKANEALDKAEKPDEMLDLSYEKMLEQITQVRRALVDIAASRKRIELQESQLQGSADHLQDQARAALGRRPGGPGPGGAHPQGGGPAADRQMEPQHQQLVDEEAKLSQTLQALQARVNQFRTQKETLKAQYTAAQAMTSVNEGVAGISKSISDSGAAVTRAQDKIAGMQARSGALDELLESGVLEDVGAGHDDIQKELDKIGASGSVDQELAALKAGIGPAAPSRPAAASCRRRPPRTRAPEDRGRPSDRRRLRPRAGRRVAILADNHDVRPAQTAAAQLSGATRATACRSNDRAGSCASPTTSSRFAPRSARRISPPT